MKEYAERKGIVEKQEALLELAARFEHVEKELLARGARTFKDFFPDVKIPEQDSQNYAYGYGGNKVEPFAVAFNFMVHDLTDEAHEAYQKL